jgi:hypothetical protein
LLSRATSWIAVLSTLAFCCGMSGLRAAESEDGFFGTWLPIEQPASCSDAESWGEGPQVVIRKDHFELGDGAPCEEVSMRIDEGKLKVSGSCENAEAGYRALVAELELPEPGLLIFRGEKYTRCEP